VPVVQIDPTSDPRWQAAVDIRGGLFQSPAWLAALADGYRVRPQALALLAPDGRVEAGLPYCRVDDFVGERIVSLPFSDYGDPLVQTDAQWRALFDHLCEPGLPVTLGGVLAGTIPGRDERLRCVGRACRQTASLERGVDDLWRALPPSRRRAIRKAERSGVTVETLDDDALLGAFVDQHVALRKRKYRLLAQPRAFFEALCRHFRAAGGWRPLAAVHGGRVIAVTVYLRHGSTLYYKFNTSSPAALELRPNDALAWAGVRMAVELGCRALDFGRTDLDQPGLLRFKQSYGATGREIQVLRSAGREGGGDSARALLRGLTELLTRPEVPDAVTRRAGELLYRFFAP
jgi:CelD/BcsL family acetyltransferase involved in cellulose biosynthesis